jgi:hypothetical protein
MVSSVDEWEKIDEVGEGGLDSGRLKDSLKVEEELFGDCDCDCDCNCNGNGGVTFREAALQANAAVE